MDALISVIVPVYKVEKYLDNCLESILAQTYGNLEIILVDDGSPDDCPIMCDNWAKKDKRIRVIHKENGGLSDARNAGLEIAAGDYIGFVDSDDWIAPNMYEVLLNECEQTGSDISACGVQMFWDDGRNQMLTCGGAVILNNEQAMMALIEESWLKQPVWYKLYKKAVAKEVPFAFGKSHEDVFWSYKVVAQAKRVSVSDKVCYYYRQREDSIMGEQFSKKRLDALEAMIERNHFLISHYPELATEAWAKTYFYGMYLAQWALREKNFEILKDIKDIETAMQVKAKFFKSAKDKVWFAMSIISFRGTCKIRNLMKIGV